MSEYVFKTDSPIKTCSECDYRCGLNIIARQNLNGRHEHCPLVELPPHGRLIDADLAIAQEKNYCEDCDNWNGIKCKTCEHDWVMMILDDALPVIEASKE